MRTVGYAVFFGVLGGLAILAMGPIGISVAGAVFMVWSVLRLEEQ